MVLFLLTGDERRATNDSGIIRRRDPPSSVNRLVPVRGSPVGLRPLPPTCSGRRFSDIESDSLFQLYRRLSQRKEQRIRHEARKARILNNKWLTLFSEDFGSEKPLPGILHG